VAKGSKKYIGHEYAQMHPELPQPGLAGELHSIKEKVTELRKGARKHSKKSERIHSTKVSEED
jgi:hypothetical protein